MTTYTFMAAPTRAIFAYIIRVIVCPDYIIVVVPTLAPFAKGLEMMLNVGHMDYFRGQTLSKPSTVNHPYPPTIFRPGCHW